MNLRFFLLCLLLCSRGALQAQVPLEGRVVDELGRPLLTVEILLLPDSLTVLSDREGMFAFSLQPGAACELQLRLAGYHSEEYAFTAPLHQPLNLRLELSPETELEGVIIYDEHAKQEDWLATEHLGASQLLENNRGTLSETLARLPGMDAIQTGVGIAKPVIRGLAFNRVIVNDQGIKQEGQQWGADHGLEIDALGVSGVEILKGPASLQYGSDGLGGVINVLPDPIPDRNSTHADLLLLAKSNNGHLGGSARVQVNRNDFWVSGRYTRQQYGDYQVPTDSFIFQGFVLPLVEGKLKNSAGAEENYKAELGLRRKKSISRLTYSHFGLEAGLFSGAVGAPRAYTLQPDGNNRDIDLPSQSVRHDKLLFNELIFLPNSHLNLNLGYQRNLRQERGFPEFHNQPEIDPANTLALRLDLQTWSGNAHLEREWRTGKLVAGISGEYQQHERGGWDFLLPDFRTSRAGAFVMADRSAGSSRWSWHGGLRFDAGRNRSAAFQRAVWNSNGVVVDSLGVAATDQVFANVSGAIGARYTVVDKRLWAKAHLGKSFRMPYPSETASNGVHHGTFRHEQGNPELRSEQGYQLDLLLDWELGAWRGEAAVFANYFEGFIYLAPSGTLSKLPEAGQIYRYRQDDAIFSGFELSWDWQIRKPFSWHQALEYVWNYNVATSLSLPFTPQPSMLNEWELKPLLRGSQPLALRVSHRWVLANGPNRVDRNERTTPGYQLVDASLGWKWEGRQGRSLELTVQGQNLLNESYLNHLSRYRLINVPEQGRNLVLTLLVKV